MLDRCYFRLVQGGYICCQLMPQNTIALRIDPLDTIGRNADRRSPIRSNTEVKKEANRLQLTALIETHSPHVNYCPDTWRFEREVVGTYDNVS